jgi:hypothetical protein
VYADEGLLYLRSACEIEIVIPYPCSAEIYPTRTIQSPIRRFTQSGIKQ